MPTTLPRAVRERGANARRNAAADPQVVDPRPPVPPANSATEQVPPVPPAEVGVECLVCGDTVLPGQGIRCLAPEAHFACDECFNNYVARYL